MKSIKVIWCVVILSVCLFSTQNSMGQDNFKLPSYEKFILDNGLVVYFVIQKEVPLVHFRGVFPAGARYDTQEKLGLSELTASALSFGTKSYSKSQIEETLDFLGASVSSNAGTEVATLAATFVSKDQDQVLPIIAEMITEPSFPAEEFEKQSQRALAALDQMRESPRSVIGSYFNAMLYKQHPYANPSSGTKQTVSTIGVSDLKDFYQSHYVPDGSVLAVVGDFDQKSMLAALKNSFKDWSTKLSVSYVANSISPLEKPQVVVVNKEDARETTMLIGGLGVPRNTEDFIGIQVINTILGGRFTSWLNDELRVNSGLTYGARSSFSSFKEGGSFSISTFTANETTAPTIELALKTYQKLLEGGVDAETLESAKNYVKGQFPPDYETNAAIARFFTDVFVYDIPINYIDTFSETVNGLTVKKAKTLIDKYFPSENLQMVFVGKASEITPLVSKYGTVKVLEIKEDSFQ